LKSIIYKQHAQKQPTHLPTHFKFAGSIATVYIAVMASWAKPEVRAELKREDPTLATPLSLEIQTVGPGPLRVEAPEGWVKKIDRAREGKVWVGYFHVWETGPDGQRVRRKKEKTLGPATKPKHEALKELADYISEHTGKVAKQGESIVTFSARKRS
jgi:hypothetical protein